MESFLHASLALSSLPEVRAVALAGSRRSLIFDDASDYDIYVYSDARIDPEERRSLLCGIGRCRIDCSPFEEGDEVTPDEGPYLDVMYRSPEWAENEVEWVWRKHNARIGYTTCFLKSIRDAEVLYSRDGWIEGLQRELNGEYPLELRRSIVRKNMDFVCGKGNATCLRQVEIAVARNDEYAQAERTCTLLSCLFDALYANSGILHPGEKKNLRYLRECGVKLPPSFVEETKEALERTESGERLLPVLYRLVRETAETVGYEA